MWPKGCACCGTSWWPTGWRALRCIGVIEDEIERLELRNCRCGTTLAMAIGTPIPGYVALYDRADVARSRASELCARAKRIVVDATGEWRASVQARSARA